MIWTLETSKPFFVGQCRYLGRGPWIMDRQQAGQIIAQVPPISVSAQPWKPLDATQEWNGKTIMVVRAGGYGDIMLATPTVRAIKQRWPKSRVVFSCHKQYACLVDGSPWVDAVAPYPLPVNDYPFDGMVWLGDVIEDNPQAEERHACDVIAARAGIELSDRALDFPTLKSTKHAFNDPPRGEYQWRVGIQLSASAAARSMSEQTLVKIMLGLNDCQILLFGHPGQTQLEDLPRVVNMSKRKLSFMQSAAAVQTCDLLIAPDSALFHVGGALGVPTIGVFGPFPFELRQTSDCQHALQGTAPCAPCFFHQQTTAFPIDQDCFKVGKCAAMESVTALMVIRKARELLNE